jgi:CHASE3 domain sensor protein
MSRKALSDDSEDGAMEPRVRKLEVKYATIAQQVDSLFDNGSPGILSQIRNALSDKIDSYFQTVSKFIEGEPARKAHIERNAQQAVADAKELAMQAVADAKHMAKSALEETEREQNRMHQENRRTSEKAELEVSKLREDFSRHEKFVQRGVGALILGQITIVFGGFCIAVITFLGGAAWWVFTHVPITK